MKRNAAPPDSAGAPYLWATVDHVELRFGSGRDECAWVPTEEVVRRVRQTRELVRACGLRNPETARQTRVLDAMAGWGVDGLVLAATGARVTLVEREALLCGAIEDLIRRVDTTSAEVACGDGYAWLDPDLDFDVVYLDPMFPSRNKQALPGKRMQYTAALLRARAESDEKLPDRPLEAWLDAAIAAACIRVVVKRRLKDPIDRRADWQIRGRTVRYDVYRGCNQSDRRISVPGVPRSGSPDR